MDRHLFNRTLWGLALIAAGVLFLLDRLQVPEFDLGHIAAVYWPVILILFGLQGIVFGTGGGSVFWGGFVALLGTFFLLRNLEIGIFTDLDVSKFILPAVLILIGLAMISGARSSRHHHAWQQGDNHLQPFKDRHWRRRERARSKFERKMNRLREKMERKYGGPPACGGGYSGSLAGGAAAGEYGGGLRNGENGAASDGTSGWTNDWTNGGNADGRPMMHRSSFIGDVYLGQDYWTLEPLFVSHFIGDTVIDLTKALIPFGETKLHVSSFIGDVKVFVPNDIQVEISVHSHAFVGEMQVLDRVGSGLFKTVQVESPYYAEAEKKIRLNIHLFIGDVQVRRVG